MSIIRLIGLGVIFSLLSACATTKSPSTPMSAAEQKIVLSDAELGRKYLLGRGVVKNEVTAFTYFKRDADAGNALSQNEVAYLYASGKGTEQDYSKALQYYQKAADQGLASAEYSVGFFYLHGLGVPVNKDIARQWISKADHRGFEPASRLLRQIEMGSAHEG